MKKKTPLFTSRCNHTLTGLLFARLRTVEPLARIRQSLTDAQFISEAPSSRAAQDIRIAHSKSEAIEPKGTRSLHDQFLDDLTALAEKFEVEVGRAKKRAPDTLTLNFGEWALYLHETYATLTVREIALRERCTVALVSKARKRATTILDAVAA